MLHNAANCNTVEISWEVCTNSPFCDSDTSFPFKIPAMTDAKEHPSTILFRDYISINTMQPNPDYPACIKFLRGVANRMGLQCWVWILDSDIELFGQNKLAKFDRHNFCSEGQFCGKKLQAIETGDTMCCWQTGAGDDLDWTGPLLARRYAQLPYWRRSRSCL